eukprot:CFRG5733T1
MDSLLFIARSLSAAAGYNPIEDTRYAAVSTIRNVNVSASYSSDHRIKTTKADGSGYGFSIIKGKSYNVDSMPPFKPRDNSTGKVDMAKHSQAEWDPSETLNAMEDSALFSWSSQKASLDSAVHVKDTKGIYWYGHNGKKYVDWASGAVCSNLGHTMPQPIKDAIIKQMNSVPFVYSDTGVVDIRGRLCALLAELSPADINGFLFASSGAEANEGAIRLAREYTGRNKIMSRYRSYHGGTTATLNLTGDPRKLSVDPFSVGFVKMLDPCPHNFEWDSDPDIAATKCLGALQEQILTEGSQTIAAIYLESIVGSNGWLFPSKKYMHGVRALCDKYGILMVVDEVMTGFGRTGTMFGFQHYDGVVPDMYTFAKGATGAFAPLSGIGVRQHLMDHFKTNPTKYGSTYSAHPMGCAVAYATIKHIIESDLCEHVQRMGIVMQEEIGNLVKSHQSVKGGRAIGIAGGFDLSGTDGNFLMGMHEQTNALSVLKQHMLREGIVTIYRGNFVHCCPPLVINEEELRDGFARVNRALDAFDADIFGTDSKQNSLHA